MQHTPDPYQDIRDAVRALCAEFPDAYHRQVDEARALVCANALVDDVRAAVDDDLVAALGESLGELLGRRLETRVGRRDTARAEDRDLHRRRRLMAAS